jgi:hypothetical protein
MANTLAPNHDSSAKLYCNMSNKSSFKMADAGIALIRFVGYGLLLLSLIDFISLFIPLRLRDPVWEVQTIKALVERAAVPLIGLAFAFYREIENRSRFGFGLLKGISWSTTGAGLLYLSLLPLLILNTIRLSSEFSEQANAQAKQRFTQLEVLSTRIQQVNAEEDLRTLAVRLNNAALTAAVQRKTAPEIKQLLLDEVIKAKLSVRSDAENTLTEKRFSLIKDTVRLSFGSVIAGTIFLWAGYFTRWARQSL